MPSNVRRECHECAANNRLTLTHGAPARRTPFRVIRERLLPEPSCGRMPCWRRLIPILSKKGKPRP